jgi:glycosyltransferase involved in cell wall biosynthesis
MKIAFNHQTFFLQAHGGISRYFTRLAQGLLDLDQDVGIFAPLYQNSYLLSLPKDIVHGKYIWRYPPKMAGVFLSLNQYISQFQMARWNPDLVHETYYSNVGNAPTGCKTVITVYDMIHELLPHNFPEDNITLSFKRRAIDRADHVICISESTKNDLLRLHDIAANKVSVVHLGFDKLPTLNNLARFSTPSGRPFILYVGQREGYKNFISLLKAVASSFRLQADFDIVVFGGSRFTSGELRKISALGFSENQVIHKSGADDLLGSLYSSATAFVYPSLYEGFGIPPLEAMAHQCPVITSNTSSMPEVIGMAGEYFDPVEADDLRRAIEDVVYSDTRIKSLQQSGIERLAFFSWGKCSRETLDIYRTLV